MLYKDIENKTLSNSGLCPYHFLFGYSQYIALELYRRFGYVISLWFDYNPELSERYILHVCNVIHTEKGKKYIDIRGIIDADILMSEFDYWESPEEFEINQSDAIELFQSMKIDYTDERIMKDIDIFIDTYSYLFKDK